MLAELFAVMAPVMAGAGLGYGWIKTGQAYPVDFVTRLVFNIGTPALILSSLSRAELSPADFGSTMLGTLLVLALMTGVTFMLCPVLKKDWKVLLSPMLAPNTGNMGLAVCLYAFGQAGFALAITIMVTLTLVQFSLGTWLSSHSGHPWRELFRAPALNAVLVSLLLMLFDISMPRWLGNALELISGFTVPLMLITLGVSLASIRAKNLSEGLVFCLVRIPLAALAAWGIGVLIGLPPMAQKVLILQMSMPVAVFNYLFAQRARREPEYVATLVFCSTMASFIYLPFLLALLMPSA
ncbi:transporter [Terasakiispira papahanaumokuakeensis]|uniref:Transporter n=1 Tax=Terasakiispira papahanaumokuakeensis TaxID=197479 RepID=A0A1E2VDD0_9GAMM|nr:AEC family transporter [Terasakiispira papahanaumokuakeensis]ODC04987.1 transporter [Terasakiispira papahanaumokuakeensis]